MSCGAGKFNDFLFTYAHGAFLVLSFYFDLSIYLFLFLCHCSMTDFTDFDKPKKRRNHMNLIVWKRTTRSSSKSPEKSGWGRSHRVGRAVIATLILFETRNARDKIDKKR